MDVEFVKSPSWTEPGLGTTSRLDRAAGTLAQLQQALDRLRARMAEPEPAVAPMARMAAMLAAAAVAPVGSAGFAAAAARAALSQRFGALELPSADAPVVSLVLSAADTADAMGSLHGLAALLGEVAGEVLLADDSADPGLALLPTLVRGIRVIGGDDGQACNLAVLAARAPVVMLLLAVLLKLGRIASPRLEAGAGAVFGFFAAAVTYPLLFAIGVAMTPWARLVAAFNPAEIAVIVATVATLIGVGFAAAPLAGLYPIDAAVVNACHSGQGGTGDVAILTAANRMTLMPFAQIATRIGGALTVIAVLAAMRQIGG